MLPTKNTVVELRSFARLAVCTPCSAFAIAGAYHGQIRQERIPGALIRLLIGRFLPRRFGAQQQDAGVQR
jgi:hypothetical protein